jgi:hypothetical protein
MSEQPQRGGGDLAKGWDNGTTAMAVSGVRQELFYFVQPAEGIGRRFV